jgi:hypothetical protein
VAMMYRDSFSRTSFSSHSDRRLRAVYHHPVLGAIMVHLHRWHAARLDVQQLDLEAVPEAGR